MLDRIKYALYGIRKSGFSWFFNKIKYRFLSFFRFAPTRHHASSMVLNDNNVLTCFYDLEVTPITYDICLTIAIYENERIKRGLKSISVVFVPGNNEGVRVEDESYDNLIDVNSRKNRILNLLLPALKTLPSISSYSVLNNRKEAETYLHSSQNIFPNQYSVNFPIAEYSKFLSKDDVNKDYSYPPLVADQTSRMKISDLVSSLGNNRKLLAVTFRNYKYQSDRDSQNNEWAKFLNTLPNDEYFIVIIPDTENSYSDEYDIFKDYYICREAAHNLLLRMALYESAWLNIGTACGPFSLCYLNQKVRYLAFLHPSFAPKKILDAAGFEVMNDFWFAKDHQHIVWEKDNFENIKNAFNKLSTEIPIQN